MEALRFDHTVSEGHCGVFGRALQVWKFAVVGMAWLKRWKKLSHQKTPCMAEDVISKLEVFSDGKKEGE